MGKKYRNFEKSSLTKICVLAVSLQIENSESQIKRFYRPNKDPTFKRPDKVIILLIYKWHD